MKTLVDSIKEGWATASDQMQRKKDVSHTIFDRGFYKDLAKGYDKQERIRVFDPKTKEYYYRPDKYKTRSPITLTKTPGKFAGALGARLLTDMGEDATRRFYWKYNHPMPILDKVAEQALGEEYTKSIMPMGRGGSSRFTPTEKSVIRLASLGIPVGASLGHLNLANPGEQFRAKGFSQKYSAPGTDDRRKTEQVAPELIDRVLLGRRGRPLKLATAQAEIPDLTPQRYKEFMRYAYQDKGPTGLGLVKATGSNLEGYPEVSIVGFPIGLQSAGALGGGITGLKQALADKKVTAGGLARRGGGYALAGALAGKLSNEIIASGNRPRYPSTLQYYG